jgi:predicted dehydrogenase
MSEAVRLPERATPTAPLRIGVIGAGKHASRSHIAPLCACPDALVVAVADPSDDVLDSVFETHPEIAWHPTAAAMLEAVPLDAVVIASPDRFHLEHLRQALDHGLSALVEKPLARDSQQLEGLEHALDEAEERHLVVSSCHPRHFDPPFLYYYMERLFYAHQLGRPLGLGFDFSYHRPSQRGLHTGLLMDHLSHELDLANWYFGPSPTALERHADSDLRYAVSGIRDDGILLTFQGTRTLERHVYRERMRIRHERGTVEVDASTGTVIVTNDEQSGHRSLSCGATDYDRRFGALNLNFVRAVLGREPSYLTRGAMLVNTAAGVALTETGVYRSA